MTSCFEPSSCAKLGRRWRIEDSLLKQVQGESDPPDLYDRRELAPHRDGMDGDRLEKIKPVLIPSLVELVKVNAHQGFIPLSTEELAEKLGQSQQSASQHLQELERLGYVERKRSGGKFAVKLTEAGQGVVLQPTIRLSGLR